MPNNKKHKPGVSIDFDGVLHLYPEGQWRGEDHIEAGPVQNAIEWLKSLVPSFRVQVFSTRNRSSSGIAAMKNWLHKHGVTEKELAAITFPMEKPMFILHFDDRAWAFNGVDFPDGETIKAFKPWNRSTPRLELLRKSMEELMGGNGANVDVDLTTFMNNLIGELRHRGHDIKQIKMMSRLILKRDDGSVDIIDHSASHEYVPPSPRRASKKSKA